MFSHRVRNILTHLVQFLLERRFLFLSLPVRPFLGFARTGLGVPISPLNLILAPLDLCTTFQQQWLPTYFSF